MAKDNDNEKQETGVRRNLWEEWNAANIKRMMASQQENGGWTGNFGGSFATSASLLSLALNYRYLPIYER